MDAIELRSRMCALVARSLAVPLEDVRAESRLVPDLGADSLDFMDLAFVLEKEFGVSVPDGELGLLIGIDWSSPDVVRDGYVTSRTIDAFAGWLPVVRDVEDPAALTPSALLSLITVASLCRIVERATSGAVDR